MRVKFHCISLLFACLLISPLAQAFVCDVTNDNVIDRTDINLIVAARNTNATGVNDVRDPDGDGRVTVLDARICTLRCTRPLCSTINSAPIAEAGSDQTVLVRQTVTLNGQTSSDPDGDPLSFAWIIVSRPTGSLAALANSNSVNPSFVVDQPGSYVVQLIVSDSSLFSSPDAVTVSTQNSMPVAQAGPNQTVRVLQTVQLNGAGSTDVDGDPLSYNWVLTTKPVGSVATLSIANIVNPSFVADKPGVYAAQLVVNDGRLNSGSSVVSITTQNSPPVADAGADKSILVTDTVQLDGNASSDVDGNALTFIWSLTTRPSGSAAGLSSPNLVNPTFVADKPGTYVAQLVVNDGSVLSSPDVVVITTRNSQPVANAGLNQSSPVGTLVQLNGGASSDVDGDMLTYRWSVLTRPAGSTAVLSGATAVNPSFTLDQPGNYIAQLIVNDGTVDSAPATVSITTANSPPIAQAGPDQRLSLNSVAQLNGNASSDPDGNALSFAWALTSRPAGSVAILSNAAIVNPSFVLDKPGTYVAQLIVSDGIVSSAPDTVVITTSNTTPVANAGPDQAVLMGAAVQLTGAASQDADGNPLSYAWSFTSRPPGSSAVLSAATIVNPSFVADIAGSYVIQLMVNDGSLDSTPDTVLVTATVANTTPSAVDDSYTVTQGGSLTAPAPGVLSNDTDGQNDPLTAALVTNVNSGTLILNANGAFSYTPNAGVSGTDSFTYRANDGTVNSAPATVRITITPTNRPPVANAGANQNVNGGNTVQLNGGASSDPDGDPLTYAWTMSAKPLGSNATLSNPTLVNPTFVADVAGPYTLQLIVNDGRVNSLGVSVTVTATAVVPVLTSIAVSPANTTIGVGANIQFTATGTFNNNTTQDLTNSVTWGSSNAAVASLSPTGAATGLVGGTSLITAGLGGISGSTTITVADLAGFPLELTLTVTPQVINNGQTTTIQLSTAGGEGAIIRQLQVDGLSQPLDATGRAIITGTAVGVHRILATVTDNAGSVTKESFYSVRNSADTTAPVAQISTPATDTEITAEVNVVGTASDANLAEYQLLVSPVGSSQYTEFARGTRSVTNGVLGQFDPSGLSNGLYDVALRAVDVNGLESTTKVTYEIAGDLKVGNFSVTFKDLEVEASGIPIVVTRTYDTRRKDEALDFGYGWSVDYQNIKIQKNMVPGTSWEVFRRGLLTLCIRPIGKRIFSVTLPDGKLERFDFSVTPDCATAQTPLDVAPVFTPRQGVTSTLRANGNQSLTFMGGTLFDTLPDIYDPQGFTLTTQEGYVYDLDQSLGIKSVRDPSGNTLTYSTSGIIHSSGKSVAFLRDPQNRITRITDPSGKSINYTYNTPGDLKTVIDRENFTATHSYNRSHGLTAYTDPRGVLLVKNEYDAQGRLIAQVDGAGNRTSVTHDTVANRQTVRDRRGNVTVYDYDNLGNVTALTDALGGITRFTYDARGNELTKTDPSGNTLTRGFNANNQITSERDPLGNTTGYAYNVQGQLTSTTDPKGNATVSSYSPTGNLTQLRDPLNQTTGFAYSGSGNLTQLTDTAGNMTRYAYDATGNRIQETDALANVINYTFDANGKELTSSRTRTTPLGAVPVTTSRTVDGNGNVTGETDALGNISRTTYNAAGKVASVTDARGGVTQYIYDVRTHLTQTIYPDGTAETTTYDAEGNEASTVNRAGQTTAYTYDALNRLIRTTNPDGSFTENTYDAAGRLTQSKDERGNATTYAYDAAGRRVGVTNALGNTTNSAYDANGNLVSETNANGQTTQYQYDPLNRRMRTLLPNSTQIDTAYDALGRKVSETDPAGNITRYTYDAAGRLIQITDALNQITRYSYDELGNRTGQIDAKGNITRWEYDNARRMTKRTLPGGQAEGFSYDANGNMLSHTDFKGQTTRYTYDSNNRELTKTYPDNTQVRTSYTPTGQIATLNDSRGLTQYSYDTRERVIRIANPDNSILTYTYDAAGNKTGLTSQIGNPPTAPPAVTTYAYDALNRLASTTDRAGQQTTYAYDAVGNRSRMNYPNGTYTQYTYDALNRLTRVEHKKTSDNSIVAAYQYTLSPQGARTQTLETLGAQTRTINYSYDALQRLTQEQVTDALNGNRTTNYTYDQGGNRLSQIETIGALPAVVTNYTYDTNDRLLSETKAGVNTSYSYDANGNTLSKSTGGVTISYSYDFDNRLSQSVNGAVTANYTYDATGNRLSQSLNGALIRYIIDPTQAFAQVIEERDGTNNLLVAYHYGDDLISERLNGAPSYYHYDALGSTRLLSNASGVVTDTYHYAAFGALIASTGTTPNSYLFTGEQFDPNLGFYYLRARYMNPAVGRFFTMDEWEGVASRPLTLNKFIYADADPSNKIDPSGKFTLGGVMSGINISLNLTLTSYDIYSWVFGNPDDAQPDGPPRLWDALMAVTFRGLAGAGGASGASLPATSIGRGGKHGHHTIPVYVCGNVKNQTLSFLNAPKHAQLHSELNAYVWIANGAGYLVDRIVFRRPTKTNLRPPIQRLARTSSGRAAIAAGLGMFYHTFDWSEQGDPSIGTVLGKETPRFIGKIHSYPGCRR